MSCKESFFYQIEHFSKNFETIAPDFLGFGKSAPLNSAFSMDDYARWLATFCKAQNIKKPHIICHSFGARVVLKALSQGYISADKIIITGGAGIVKARTVKYKIKVKVYRALKKIAPRFAEKHCGSKEYRALSPVMKESYKKIVNEDLSVCAGQIDNDVLLIYGKDDKTTPLKEEGQIFNGLIKNSKLVALDGGHFCFCQNYQDFNRIAGGFLTE